MYNYRFLIDLDATLTKREILPALAEQIDRAEEMKQLTEQTMLGELPFEESFLNRVQILSEIPVSQVRELVRQIPLHEELAAFIRENKERCYIVTGNLDVWISGLMEDLGLDPEHCICSHALTEGDRVLGVEQVQDKAEVVKRFADQPFVAIGDGNNDAAMIAAAEVGIGFGGVRPIAPALLRCATHAVYSEEKLCQFLRQLL